jgi:branched-chain amino acid transport system substrate-binding protein
MPMPRFRSLAAALGLLIVTATAHADVNIGVLVSLTGPGASLGIPAENTVKLWPTELGGQKINVIVLNDATDATTAVKNATKLITEDKVDIIVGPSLTPTSLAVIDVAARTGVPVISLAGGGAIVEPQDGPRRWAFKMAPTETISINAVLDHMLKNKATTVATIGITTAYGEGFLKAIEKLAPAKGVKIVAVEKYAQADTSATPQVLKLLAANPDAVYIFSAGTPGALPHVELVKRGYKGLIY